MKSIEMELKTIITMTSRMKLRTTENIDQVLHKFHNDQPLMKLTYISNDTHQEEYCFIVKARVEMIAELV